VSRKVKQPEQPDPTTAYANAVIAGEILAGRPVRLACERHIRDLKEGKARGLMLGSVCGPSWFHEFGLDAEGGEEGLLLATDHAGDQVDRLGYDPLCGCGLTLLAAAQLNRIDPGYAAVALHVALTANNIAFQIVIRIL